MEQPVGQEVYGQLSHIIGGLLSSNNDQRKAAEEQLNNEWVVKNPDTLLLCLSDFAAKGESADLRSYCSVLLRRVAFKPLTATSDSDTGLWDTVKETTREQSKGLLLIALGTEPDLGARHKVSDTISEIAKFDLNRDLNGGVNWDGLLNSLISLFQSQDAAHNESAFRIFSSAPQLFDGKGVDVFAIFQKGLANGNQGVRLEAMKAATAYIVDADEESQKAFTPMMPGMLEFVNAAISNQDDSTLVEGIVILIDLGDSCPRLFYSILPGVLQCMVSIAKEKQFEDATRQTALELLLTLSDAKPAMARKCPNFASEVIAVALGMMTDMEDDEDWYTTDDLEEDENEENYVMGESALDRIARSLGGKSVAPICFECIPGMLKAPQWQQHRAALMAISSIGEGSFKFLKRELPAVINFIMPSFKDPHPRVRYAACNTIGQMSTDFAPLLQNKFHDHVIPALLGAMKDPQPRVQAHAAAAMVNFCEDANKDVLEPYLDQIFEQLLELLKTSKTYVQEQAITTIATVADCVENGFIKYHSVIMPLLLNILRQASEKQYRLLRSRAIECASLIGLAIRKEAFAPYTNDFISILAEIQQTPTEDDDLQITYLLAAWARMCKMMGQDFLPYLPNVMPPLLQSAKITPEFTFVDPDNADAEAQYSSEEGWEFVSVNGQQVGIKTSVLEEKYTAIEMLVSYTRDLGAGFLPYIPVVFDIALPLLKFYFHDGVRTAAAALIPLLLKGAKEANVNPADFVEMQQTAFAKLSKALTIEDDPAFLSTIFVTFSECFDYGVLLEDHYIQLFIKCAMEQAEKLLVGLDEREKLKVTEEYDAEDEEHADDEEVTEEDALSELAHAIQSLFKAKLLGFLPYFDTMLPLLRSFLSHPSSGARQWAICVFDDLIEFTGPNSYNYVEHFSNAMAAGISDKAKEIRQASVYGFGVMGQFGGPQYAGLCANSLQSLFNLIDAPESREEGSVYVTENAISAIAKICKFNPSQVQALDQVLSKWFSSLPILQDEQEAPVVYTYLLDRLEAYDPSILGQNNANIPHLVKVFTEVLATGILTEEVATRMVNSLKVILGGVDEATRGQLWSTIPPEIVHALQKKGYI